MVVDCDPSCHSLSTSPLFERFEMALDESLLWEKIKALEERLEQLETRLDEVDYVIDLDPDGEDSE
jgi:hypothetical protein